METSHSQMVALIWNIADDVLRDVFLRGQYRDVILPMVVLRRLDALLEPTKNEVDEEVKEQQEMQLGTLDEDAIKDITGLSYGETTLFATTEDGGFQTSMQVKVGDYENSLRLTNAYVSGADAHLTVQNISDSLFWHS